MTDGWLLPKSAQQIYAEGKQNHVPTIAGTNRDEGTMFTPLKPFASIDEYEEKMAERFGQHSDAITNIYAVHADDDERTRARRCR